MTLYWPAIILTSSTASTFRDPQTPTCRVLLDIFTPDRNTPSYFSIFFPSSNPHLARVACARVSWGAANVARRGAGSSAPGGAIAAAASVAVSGGWSVAALRGPTCRWSRWCVGGCWPAAGARWCEARRQAHNSKQPDPSGRRLIRPTVLASFYSPHFSLPIFSISLLFPFVVSGIFDSNLNLWCLIVIWNGSWWSLPLHTSIYVLWQVG